MLYPEFLIDISYTCDIISLRGWYTERPNELELVIRNYDRTNTRRTLNNM